MPTVKLNNENILTKVHSTRQLERAMKRMGVRKYIKDNQWKYIRAKVEKREGDGKKSAVFVYGNRISEPRLRRELGRHSETIFERLGRREYSA